MWTFSWPGLSLFIGFRVVKICILTWIPFCFILFVGVSKTVCCFVHWKWRAYVRFPAIFAKQTWNSPSISLSVVFARLKTFKNRLVTACLNPMQIVTNGTKMKFSASWQSTTCHKVYRRIQLEYNSAVKTIQSGKSPHWQWSNISSAVAHLELDLK